MVSFEAADLFLGDNFAAGSVAVVGCVFGSSFFGDLDGVEALLFGVSLFFGVVLRDPFPPFAFWSGVDVSAFDV